MVVHTFNVGTQAGRSLEFKASLVYRSSRMARATTEKLNLRVGVRRQNKKNASI